MLNRLRRDESGQILAVAVAFLALFGLAAVATLGWSTASLGLARATSDRIDRVYTADAGVDHAIEMLRRETELGVTGDDSCYTSPEANGNFSLPELNGLETGAGTVAYAARPNSGTCLGTTGTATNTPAYALFTACRAAGTPCDPGRSTGALDFVGNNTPASPSVFTSRGDVYSADELQLNDESRLTTSAADSVHPGNVRTHNGGACPSGVTVPSQAVANCNLGGTFDTTPAYRLPDATLVDEDDPGTMELLDPDGTDVSATKTVFSPGRYVEPPILDEARLYVFDPGIYYFDFLSDGSGSDVWTIDTADASVVGGVLTDTGWADGDDPSFPGACDTAESGVEFVFGASSRLVVGGVRGFELCPFLPDPDDQHIAIYGAYQNVNPQGNLLETGAAHYSPTLDTKVSGTWKQPQKVYSLGRKEATVSSATNGQTVTHEWSGYVESDIPSGASVTKIIVHPHHRETGNAGYSLSTQAFVTSGSTTGSTANTTVPNNLAGSIDEDTLTMSLTTPVAFTDSTSNRQQIRVRFSMTKSNSTSTTLRLDWLPITIGYVPSSGGPEQFVPVQAYDSPTLPVPPDTSGGNWSNPERAFAQDGSDANENLTGPSASSSSQEWWGFSEFLVPAGAQIQSVTAYPLHREDAGATYSMSLRASVTGGDGVTRQSPEVTVPQNNTGTFRQDEVLLPLSAAVPWNDDPGAQQVRIRYTLNKTGAGQARVRVDWIPIVITYTLPWRAASGCVLADTCALVDASDADNQLGSFVQGTYYAPQGRLVARTAPLGQAVFGRGAIASSARFLMRAGQTTAAVAQVPPTVGLNVADREVLITVNVGTTSATALVGFDAFFQVPTVRTWYVK